MTIVSFYNFDVGLLCLWAGGLGLLLLVLLMFSSCFLFFFGGIALCFIFLIHNYM